MSNKKGIGAMVLVVIILALLGVTVILDIFWMMVEPIFMNTYGCDIYCNIHHEAEDYSRWAWWPSWLGGSVSWSDIIIDKARAGMAKPAAAGCYCGVDQRNGKYMHVHTAGGPENIYEFHLTKQNPAMHLKYKATGFDHTGGFDACEEIIEEEDKEDLGGFSGIQDAEACLIVSVQKDNDGNYNCAVWKAGEGSVLNNSEGSIEDTLQGYERYGDDFDGPVEDIEIGDSVSFSGGHSSQRMLLQNVSEESTEFRFAAPVVCKSDGRNEEEADSMVDKACRDYCNDEEEIFWGSTCSETPVENYDLLPEEYRKSEDLCPETQARTNRQEKASEEDPYCSCKAEKRYYWEVDEEYEPEVENGGESEGDCYSTGKEQIDSCEEWCEEELEGVTCGGEHCEVSGGAYGGTDPANAVGSGWNSAENSCYTYDKDCNEEVTANLGEDCSSVKCSCTPV
ncbi:MAG: hypothetical protein ACLFQ8_01315 [Candidatus Aenigmatarchaeota archaeon]